MIESGHMVSLACFWGFKKLKANYQIGSYPKIPIMQTATIPLPELMSDVSYLNETIIL